MRILVCEDQDAIRCMIETLVAASGHAVAGVATGSKAVERALAESFDVCQRWRADDRTRDLPIFVISAMDDPESRARAMTAGATAFYGKPFSPVALLKDIDGLAKKTKRRSKRPKS